MLRRTAMFLTVTFLGLLLLVGCTQAPTSITVHGTVIGVLGDPLAGATVTIGSTSVTSGADGTFTVAGVARPYDVGVVDPSSSSLMLYLGLNGAAPYLQSLGGSLSSNSVTLSGTLSGAGSFPLDASHGAVVVPGWSGIASGAASMGTGDGPAFGPFTASWYGPAATTFTLFGIEVHLDTSSKVDGMVAYGHVDVPVTDGGTITSVAVPLSSVGTGHVTGTLAAGSGMTLDQMRAHYAFASGGRRGGISAPMSLPSGTAIDLLIPDDPSVTMAVAAQATGAAGTSYAWTAPVAPGSTSVALTVPAPVALGMPADGATGVTLPATFSWSQQAGKVYALELNASASGPSVFVVTSSTSFDLPDLTTYGLPALASASYDWKVLTLGGYGSVDEVAGPSGWTTTVELALADSTAPPEAAGSYAISNARSLTFAP